MCEATKDWPAGLFAVMQNLDNTPEYYRPWRPEQKLGEFIDEVALIAVRGLITQPPTSFSRVISSETGETDEAMTILVQDLIQKHHDAVTI